MQVLDVGCGNAKIHGAVGVDIDHQSDADLIHSAENLTELFDSNEFDLAYSSFLIEHVDNPGLVISQMMTVAKRCYIKTDDGSCWRLHHRWVRRHAHQEMYGRKDHHVMLFQPEHLITLIERRGGKILKLRRNRSYRKIDRFLWLLGLRDFCYRSFEIWFTRREANE